MGLIDLLLRKARGVGELKSEQTEYSLNANVMRVLKELQAVDQKAGFARKQNNLSRNLSCIREQMSLIEQIEHFALVRMIRLEYDYKSINSRLNEYEKHYANELIKIKQEEKKLMKGLKHSKEGQKPDAAQIREHIYSTKKKLTSLQNHIRQLRAAVRDFRKLIREKCKNKMIKIKKVYHFA